MLTLPFNDRFDWWKGAQKDPAPLGLKIVLCGPAGHDLQVPCNAAEYQLLQRVMSMSNGMACHPLWRKDMGALADLPCMCRSQAVGHLLTSTSRQKAAVC